MSTFFFLLPLFSAIAGYVFSLLFANLYFTNNRIKRYLLQTAKVFTINLVSSSVIEKQLSSKDAYEKLVPEVEKQIDLFLRVKLVKEMPYVGSLIGETTINSLKKLFMQELEILFPEVIQHYAKHIFTEADAGKIMAEQIAVIPPAKIKTLFKNSIQSFAAWGLLLGFVTGLLQLLFIFLIIG